MTAAIVLADSLLSCLTAQLAAGPNPPAQVMLRAGSEVTPLLSTVSDECCGGLGWVRIDSISGVRQLGERDGQLCFSQERTLTLEIGVARCAPVAQSASTVPTAEQWEAVAFQLDADQGAMEAAVCCAFGSLEGTPAEEVAVGDYRPFGVDGNCIGGTMTVTLRMYACCP
jgi:hypothetical protein